jgi:hypothetical protein
VAGVVSWYGSARIRLLLFIPDAYLLPSKHLRNWRTSSVRSRTYFLVLVCTKMLTGTPLPFPKHLLRASHAGLCPGAWLGSSGLSGPISAKGRLARMNSAVGNKGE